jgi:quinol monooxygenase YgiN
MVKLGLFVRLEAKPGKEAEVASFLKRGLALAEAEPGTITWYALQLGKSTFGVFDTFESEDSRNAHLNGKLAAALMAQASELFSQPPSIEQIDLLAVTPAK